MLYAAVNTVEWWMNRMVINSSIVDAVGLELGLDQWVELE